MGVPPAAVSGSDGSSACLWWLVVCWGRSGRSAVCAVAGGGSKFGSMIVERGVGVRGRHSGSWLWGWGRPCEQRAQGIYSLGWDGGESSASSPDFGRAVGLRWGGGSGCGTCLLGGAPLLCKSATRPSLGASVSFFYVWRLATLCLLMCPGAGGCCLSFGTALWVVYVVFIYTPPLWDAASTHSGTWAGRRATDGE